MVTNERFEPEIENFREDTLRLTSEAKDALTALMRNLTSSPISRLSYAYTARVKTEHGILEKIRRKRAGDERNSPKPEYKLADITDIIGIRFVTLYRNQIGMVLEYILAELSGGIAPDSMIKATDLRNMFARNSLKETIIYRNNIHDIFVPRWENVINKVCSDKLAIQDKADYSSIHIVACLNAPDSSVLIPIEIQIRSVFDDAWGQLNHAYQYASQSGKKNDTNLNNPQFIHKLLSNLKQFTDACANYADLIYEEAKGDFDSVPSAEVLDVQDSNAVLGIFRSLKVRKDLIAVYQEAVRAKEHADIQKNNKQVTSEEVDLAYSHAATCFRKAFQSAQESPDFVGKSEFEFYSLLNEALCYLSSTMYIGKALELYAELLQQKAEHPMLLFRYGQALEKCGDPTTGVEFVRKGWEAAKTFTIENKHKSPEFLLQDLLHLSLSAPRKIGYNIWSHAEKAFLAGDMDGFDFGERLAAAYKVSRDGLDFLESQKIENQFTIKDLASLHNNLLYYATELVRLTVYESHLTDHWMSRVKEHLHYIEMVAGVNDDDILRMDTLWRAHLLVGNVEKCVSYATKVHELALSRNANLLLADEALRQIAWEAFSVLKQTKADS